MRCVGRTHHASWNGLTEVCGVRAIVGSCKAHRGQHDCAGSLEPIDSDRVAARKGALERQRAGRDRDARAGRDVDVVLDGDGYTVQETADVTGRSFRVELLGLSGSEAVDREDVATFSRADTVRQRPDQGHAGQRARAQSVLNADDIESLRACRHHRRPQSRSGRADQQAMQQTQHRRCQIKNHRLCSQSVRAMQPIVPIETKPMRTAGQWYTDVAL